MADGSSPEETVQGTVIDARTVADCDHDMLQYFESEIHFRDLESGTYKLVKVDDK